MKTLTPVGFFVESYPEYSRESIKSVLQTRSLDYDPDALSNYLVTFPWCGVMELRYAYDEFGSVRKKIDLSTIVTDGEYVWPGVLAYYVRIYDLSPPPYFVNHIKSRLYAPPSDVELNADVAKRMDYTLRMLWESAHPGQ